MFFLTRTLLSTVALFSSILPAATSRKGDLSLQQMRERFTVTSEVFVFDESGKKLLAKGEGVMVMKAARGDTSSLLSGTFTNESDFFDGILAVKTSWSIDANGSVKVRLTEYATDTLRDDDLNNVLKTEERSVDLMESVTWVSAKKHSGKKVVLRYTPNVSDEVPTDMTAVRIAGEDVAIVDNTGSLWADHLSFDGKYLGIMTHRGTLLLSYYPFQGSKELGVAVGNRVELVLGKNVVVSLISKSSFLPGSNSGKVYGSYLSERKSTSLTSVHINASNQEDVILKLLL